ncbi:MAG: nitrilase [Desulfobacterales bacterium]|jgi:N-carbamoylputrescine amidase|nr:nitrilase [Desulfobacterales bacterium]
MKDIRIAAVVCLSRVHQIDENVRQVQKWVHAAKEKGVELICFPEMNVTGYSHLKDICRSAQDLSGPVVRNLIDSAISQDITILAGLAEKHTENRVWASHLVLKPNGSCEVYRKVHIAPPEKDILSAGNDIPVFESRGVKFGIQLCYDAHFPEPATSLAINGADIIFLPHASPRGTPESKYHSWMRHLPARACDNGVFIVACNQTGDNDNGLQFPGLSVIIGPSGNLLEKDTSGKEGLLVGDLKAGDLDAVRGHRMRYFLPNRRPELYSR